MTNTRRDNRRKWGIIVNYASQSKNHENYFVDIANSWCLYPSEGGAGAGAFLYAIIIPIIFLSKISK